jgi:hypothetical protein
MIGAGLGFWSGGESYLDGNAKVYDGSFDYDQIVGWSQIERTQAWAMNIATKINPSVAVRLLFEQGASSVDRGIVVYITSADILFIEIANNSGNRVVAETYKSIIINYDGGSNASGVNAYVDGVLATKTIVQNNLSATIIQAGGTTEIGGRSPGSLLPFNGLIRQFEIINRIATAGEISDTATFGSFRGAGVSHASGQYLLAIDTDKVNGQNLTTFAGTPTYTITAFGGATYTPYL